MTTKTRRIACLGGTAALALAAAAEGAFIYGAAYGDGVYRIDVDAGAVERLGAYADAWALSASADAGVLLVANHNGRLTRFDIATGATSLIGGQWTTNSLGLATDGFLYSGSWSNGQLRRIDPTTGAATVVGVGSVRGYAGDLAAAPSGDLFGVTRDNELVLVSVADGSTTKLLDIVGAEAWGIATTYDGRYWVSSGSSLHELDMSSGALRHVMDLGFEAYDLASMPGMTFGQIAVPAPSGSLALAGLGLLLACGRRRVDR